jgi:ubiquinone/menaquinone biosynthesis C-methylase UbiE
VSLFGRVYAAGFDVFERRTDARGGREQRRKLVGDAGGEVLEVGAGTGRNLTHYEKAARVVALEPDPNMRARAQRPAAKAAVPVEVVEGDGMALPFPDASFDTVVTCLVLCTIPDPALALAEARRVLRPGGELRFYEHVRSPDPAVAHRQDRYVRPWRWVARGCHPNRDTLAAIETAGFHLGPVEDFDQPGVPSIVRLHVRGQAGTTGAGA